MEKITDQALLSELKRRFKENKSEEMISTDPLDKEMVRTMAAM